jgi:uncharacterized membrane protein YhhN
MLAPALTLCTLLFVVLLLLADRGGRSRRALVAKSCASACFVLLGLLGSGLAPRGAFDSLILAGLCCALVGDVCLALPGERAFQAGVGAFWCCHALYVAAAYRALNGAAPPGWAWLVCVPSLAAYAWLYRHLGVMRLPVAAYIGVITTLVAYALALHQAQPTGGFAFALGALLFYASDLSVARDKFVQSAFVNRLWGLPAYYAGQLLIAWSTAAL